MKLSLKKALAALGVVACVAAPTFADTGIFKCSVGRRSSGNNASSKKI